MAATDRNRVATLLGTAAPVVVSFFDGSTGHVLDAGQVTGYTVTRGRKSPRDQSGPGACSFTFLGELTLPDGFQVEVGRTVRVDLSAAAVAHLAAAAGTAARFVGQVTDLGDLDLVAKRTTPLPVPVVATTLQARFGNTDLGGPPWPPGTSDVQILLEALTLAWESDPGLQVYPFTDADAWLSPIMDRDPVPPAERFVSWDVDAQTASQIVDDLAASTNGVLLERRDGTLDWLTPVGRRDVLPTVTLDASQVLSPLTMAQKIGDVVNMATVSYGADGAEASVTFTDDPSRERSGNLPVTVSTKLAEATAAGSIALDLLSRYAMPTWNIPTVTVDLTALLDLGQAAVVAQVLAVEVGDLIEVLGLPSDAPSRGGQFWVEGMTETMTSSRWRIEFAVAAYALLAASPRWDDVAATTWNDLPADLTWEAATHWHPDPYPIGAWHAQASDLRWTSVAPSTLKWNAYPV